MDIQGFDPREKAFHFRLDKYSCYRCATGICSLENITLEEIENSESCVHAHDESSIEYCIGMAKMFLDNEFTAPANIYLNTKCGHYSFADGQHRTCVVAQLLKKGGAVILNAKVTAQDCVCRDCFLKKYYAEQTERLTLFDKLFASKRYSKLKKSEKDYAEHEFICYFDK